MWLGRGTYNSFSSGKDCADLNREVERQRDSAPTFQNYDSLQASRLNEVSRLESLLRQQSEEEIGLGASTGGFGVEEKKDKDKK